MNYKQTSWLEELVLVLRMRITAMAVLACFLCGGGCGASAELVSDTPFVVFLVPTCTHAKRRCQGRNRLKFSGGQKVITYCTKKLKMLFHNVLFSKF